MLILGIETSCDETAVGILEIKKNQVKILSNLVYSQAKIHQKYGGVVPEVAARKHVETILPLIKLSLEEALVSPTEIDLIAVTRGPGLVTSLLVGVETAKSLAYVWQKPLVGVNHLAGHLYSSELGLNRLELRPINFPALGLIVSGGHTELVLMKSHQDYRVIGQTIDDAAGEAFDKAAKLLGLNYPGGPEISRLAKAGDPSAFDLPRPMIKSKDFNFSFSGLKTAVLYKIKNDRLNIKNQQIRSDFCAAIEAAITDVLVEKTIRAAKIFGVKTILLGGGVSANEHLRELLNFRASAELSRIKILLPEIGLSTDNGLVIALAGYYVILNRESGIKNQELRIRENNWRKIKVDPNLEL